jgi:hypothetical protein
LARRVLAQASSDTGGVHVPESGADLENMQILSRSRLLMDATGLLFAFSLIALVSQGA